MVGLAVLRRVNFKCHSFILIFVDGFLCLFRFFEWNWQWVHGGMSMASAVFWDISQFIFFFGECIYCALATHVDLKKRSLCEKL